MRLDLKSRIKDKNTLSRTEFLLRPSYTNNTFLDTTLMYSLMRHSIEHLYDTINFYFPNRTAAHKKQQHMATWSQTNVRANNAESFVGRRFLDSASFKRSAETAGDAFGSGDWSQPTMRT
ncbi:hypothetical protein GWI33_015522 [Rhynchophorus ferrugineus]|uniref:Uncharacterized protein n=1 Tax=Rhynchophorus ferrugineus TaxID=354439 RepID=A0A834I370_RHYFE|nr:hypothetical protein GWI33_015522 [Rhynchophorus ferrugineus]